MELHTEKLKELPERGHCNPYDNKMANFVKYATCNQICRDLEKV